jgi:filamentous hemagglutinin family protein
MSGSFGTLTAMTRLKSRALGSTALTVLAVMATHAAWAAPPAAGSLPGAFSTNDAASKYTGTGTTATITVTPANTVLQWGGTALTTKVSAPSGITTNPGFSIGSGASLILTGAATSVLVSDLTGSPSQIFGSLNASGLGAGAAQLYVSNTNGVIVGASGVINAPSSSVGLLGYAVDPATFVANGFVTVDNSTAGTGGVTTMAGASIGGGPLLIASNGTVNIGAVSSAASPSNYVAVGVGFTTAPSSNVIPVFSSFPPTVLPGGASSVVNFTGPATLSVDQLAAAGAVNNAATLTLTDPAVSGISAITNLNVAGLFTNTGQVTETNNVALNQLAGGLANLGTITEATGPNLTITSTKGNVQNTGVLVVPAAGANLSILAANIDIEGKVQAGTKAISASNALGTLTLATTAGPPQAGGVVDVGASLFTKGGVSVGGNAIRIVSGGIFDSGGTISLNPGTNAAGVADPFYMLKSLNYTFSTFPGTMVQETAAGGQLAVFNPQGSNLVSNSAGVNLNGPLSVTGSGSTIFVLANNINSNNGLAGGFAVADKSTINLQFFGT